jgi:hypothetical protein
MALVSGEKFFARVNSAAKGGSLRAPGALNCSECNTSLQEALTGCRRLGDGSHVCSDCYFELSSALEKFPIVTPRVRRR